MKTKITKSQNKKRKENKNKKKKNGGKQIEGIQEKHTDKSCQPNTLTHLVHSRDIRIDFMTHANVRVKKKKKKKNGEMETDEM